MFNRSTLLILLVAVGAGAGLLTAQRFWLDAPAARPALAAVTLYPSPRALPGFTLQAADGRTLGPAQLGGRWTLVFIGFTSCPDICPTTLTQLARAQRQWQVLPENIRPQVLFVSVDPERDSPERLAQYAHAFHPDTLAASADLPMLEAFTRSLSLVFAKVAVGQEADQYSIDHSAAIAVLDPQVRMAGVIPGSALDPDALARDLLTLSTPAQTTTP